MSEENERALLEEYERGFEDGQAEKELEMLDELEEHKAEAWQEGYDKALERATRLLEGLQ